MAVDYEGAGLRQSRSSTKLNKQNNVEATVIQNHFSALPPESDHIRPGVQRKTLPTQTQTHPSLGPTPHSIPQQHETPSQEGVLQTTNHQPPPAFRLLH